MFCGTEVQHGSITTQEASVWLVERILNIYNTDKKMFEVKNMLITLIITHCTHVLEYYTIPHNYTIIVHIILMGQRKFVNL